MLHSHDPTLNIILTKNFFFFQYLTSNAVFTIGVSEKNVFLGSCHRFQEIHILPKNSVEQKKLRSMSISKLKQSVF